MRFRHSPYAEPEVTHRIYRQSSDRCIRFMHSSHSTSMKPPKTGTFVAGIVLGLLGVAAIEPIGPLPALGKFFDPVHGIVGSVCTAELPDSATLSIPGLSAETRVVYDDRAVPHIFAASIEDAYRALGF